MTGRKGRLLRLEMIAILSRTSYVQSSKDSYWYVYPSPSSQFSTIHGSLGVNWILDFTRSVHWVIIIVIRQIRFRELSEILPIDAIFMATKFGSLLSGGHA
jgi:hypothetical protein